MRKAGWPALLLVAISLSMKMVNSDDNLSWGRVVIEQTQVTIPVEIATSPAQREQGLMHRDALPPGQGMLFEFADEKKRWVWMKNMRFAIDVLFLSANGVIVTQLNNLQPCRKHPCPAFSSQQPAAYMLELNAGCSDQLNLQTGSRLRIETD